MTDVPAFGIYEELRHLRLQELLDQHPELRSVFGKLDTRRNRPATPPLFPGYSSRRYARSATPRSGSRSPTE